MGASAARDGSGRSAGGKTRPPGAPHVPEGAAGEPLANGHYRSLSYRALAETSRLAPSA